jgi:hypothetical protein
VILYSVAFHLLLGASMTTRTFRNASSTTASFDWVIVRTVILTDGLKTNAYRALVDPRDWTCGFISCRRGGFPRQADRRRRLSA